MIMSSRAVAYNLHEHHARGTCSLTNIPSPHIISNSSGTIGTAPSLHTNTNTLSHTTCQEADAELGASRIESRNAAHLHTSRVSTNAQPGDPPLASLPLPPLGNEGQRLRTITLWKLTSRDKAH